MAIRHLVVQLTDGVGVVLGLLRGFEWKNAEQHLHQENSKAPAICSEVIPVAFDHLVWIVAWSASSSLESVRCHLDCKAKVTQEDLAIIVDHDVFRLDISVENPFHMASFKCSN